MSAISSKCVLARFFARLQQSPSLLDVGAGVHVHRCRSVPQCAVSGAPYTKPSCAAGGAVSFLPGPENRERGQSGFYDPGGGVVLLFAKCRIELSLSEPWCSWLFTQPRRPPSLLSARLKPFGSLESSQAFLADNVFRSVLLYVDACKQTSLQTDSCTSRRRASYSWTAENFDSR